jgi:hypothetical protein
MRKAAPLAHLARAIASLRLRATVSVVEEGDIVATDVHGMATTSSEPTGPFGTRDRCVLKGGSTDWTSLPSTAAGQCCPRVGARDRVEPRATPYAPTPARKAVLTAGREARRLTRRGQYAAPVALISAVALGRDLERSAGPTLDPRVGRARRLAPPRA